MNVILRKLLLLTITAVLLPLLSACETKPGVIFPPLKTPVRWPPPPDEARIAYVGKLVTSEDLKPGVKGFDALGQAIFGKKESHSMLTPMAVCTDGASGGSRVFVADSNAQLVHVFDLKSRLYTPWKPGKNQPTLSQPVGIAWDPVNTRLLVSDSVGGALFVFNSAGKFQGLLGQGVLQRPVGIAVDAKHGGRIFVADAKAHQIIILSAAGALERRLGSRGAGPGQFNFPTNVALDPTGRLYVSDSLNFRVQQFDADLNPLRVIGKKGDLPGYFAQPKGIATDSEGHLYVLDAQFENLQIFNDQGQVLMDFGEEGSGPGQFWLPAAIFIDGNDRLWITDSYNRRLQIFDYKKVPTEVKP